MRSQIDSFAQGVLTVLDEHTKEVHVLGRNARSV
jgi:hypothetical protein